MQKLTAHIKNKEYIFSLVMLCFLSSTQMAYAATFDFNTDIGTMGVGQTFAVPVIIDSEGQTINAVGGEIIVPDFVRIDEVRDGNSLVSLWAKRPEVKDDVISFAGVIPGGWSGGDGELFTLILTADAVETGVLSTQNIEVLLHDGKGTHAPFHAAMSTLSVADGVPVRAFDFAYDDTELPEPFVPEVVSDPSIFNGASFLIFDAEDKGSGIDHYELKESSKRIDDVLSGEWEEVLSPYLIKDQTLQGYIYVRAIDRAGNVRVATVAPTTPGRDYTFMILACALIFLVLVVVYKRRRLR